MKIKRSPVTKASFHSKETLMPTLLPHDHGHNHDTEHLLTHMPDLADSVEAASLFALLGDSSRIRIFWLLCHTEECVCNIAAAVGMSDAAVSHHLKILRLNELISSRREGKEIHYSLADNERAKFAHQILDDYFRISCPCTPHQ